LFFFKNPRIREALLQEEEVDIASIHATEPQLTEEAPYKYLKGINLFQ
jgi:hypothetical protein